MESNTQVNRPDWFQLLNNVLAEPGVLGDYYHAFHNYSLGNQVLAVEQMSARGIPVAPIASFNAWKAKGRMVRKGQKAIALFMPVTFKSKRKSDEKAEGPAEKADSAGSENSPAVRRAFVMKNNWFALSQTDVDPTADVPAPEPEKVQMSWNKDQALVNLDVKEVDFTMVNGNIQGFARPSQREISISPLAAMPHKSRFHELAHVLLHGNEPVEMVDGTDLMKCIKEAEAETTAYLCCAALGLPGLDLSRGYVQSWLRNPGSQEAFKKSAGRVFSAADKILKAGLVVEGEGV